MKEKWKNWWWYHWGHVLLAVAVLAIVLYSVLPGLLTPKPDYRVAVVARYGLSDEAAAALEQRLQGAADDRNGDGKILLRLQLFALDLSETANVGENYMEAAKLDADLASGLSELFLIDDPAGFERSVAAAVEPGVPCASLPLFEGLSLPEGAVFTIRADASPQARSLYERIAAG